jgi:hypothetical protein
VIVKVPVEQKFWWLDTSEWHLRQIWAGVGASRAHEICIRHTRLPERWSAFSNPSIQPTSLGMTQKDPDFLELVGV